ncbi:MAG: hypothetical protein H6607_09520 [Flavobacteriales bacterium]|nr:hypothetical protein [Flavobacteriales bacterium]
MSKSVRPICTFTTLIAFLFSVQGIGSFGAHIKDVETIEINNDSLTIDCLNNITNYNINYKVSRPRNVEINDSTYVYTYVIVVSCSSFSNFYSPQLSKESLKTILKWFDDESKDWVANMIFYSITESNLNEELLKLVSAEEPWVEWRKKMKVEDKNKWTNFVSNI